MKFTVAFLVIVVCLFASVQGNRYKRTVSLERCPKDVDCESYAKVQAAKFGPCSSYSTNGIVITYYGCGTAFCGENTREIEDMSKPYPQCCPDCEVIDPSKPAHFRRTL